MQELCSSVEITIDYLFQAEYKVVPICVYHLSKKPIRMTKIKLLREAETYLWTADLQQVNGLPANVHVVREVSQEERHAVFHIF